MYLGRYPDTPMVTLYKDTYYEGDCVRIPADYCLLLSRPVPARYVLSIKVPDGVRCYLMETPKVTVDESGCSFLQLVAWVYGLTVTVMLELRFWLYVSINWITSY
ncbi:hypothetical protein M752DRAFT_269084 [Aspergillus phoenicis ATCC 13157]|uniref:Uncharacterized protein n=1 Tax=Aspergillus phoenicis ATCC 13157 TaxID=1353007 RepID=A0A370PBC2_ASPPH|nr:hypothetical protein M752DRAFT_269084 [Aspergillus phoenicis ATCC 13157]